MTTTTLTFSPIQVMAWTTPPHVEASMTGSGGDATWTDASDATYSTAVTAKSGTTTNSMVAGYIAPITGVNEVTDLVATVRVQRHNDFVSGVSFLVELYADVGVGSSGNSEGVGYYGALRFATSADGDTALAVSANDVIEDVGGLVFDGAFSDFPGTPMEILETALTDGAWIIPRPQATGLGSGNWYLDVYEVTLTVTYGATIPTEVIRATRQFPRDDALGLGSAPRLYPPPRSGRVVGGHM